MKFDHVAITVSDMERSVKFYRDILGFKVLGKLENPEAGSLFVYLDTGSAIIELFQFKEKGAPWDRNRNEDYGLKHFCFRVDSVDEVIERLKAAGVKIVLEPFDATGGVRIAFFEDPDGVRIELIERELQLEPYEG